MGVCGSSHAHHDQQQQHAPVAQSTRRPAAQQQQQQQQRESTGEGAGRNQRASFAASVIGWDKNFPAMSRSGLAAKRDEFWDTRVSGRAEVWQTLRVACEAGDEETAGAILESADLTQLDTEVAGTAFVYDRRLGYKYEVPLYCLYTPSNLMSDAPAPLLPTPAKNGQHTPLQVQVAPVSARQPSAQQQQSSAQVAAADEVKSPEGVAAAAPIGSGKTVKFKIRFSNGLPDFAIEQRTSCSISQLQSLIHARHPSLTPDRLRIYYLGKHMADGSWNLGAIGMRKEMVLQCFVITKQA